MATTRSPLEQEVSTKDQKVEDTSGRSIVNQAQDLKIYLNPTAGEVIDLLQDSSALEQNAAQHVAATKASSPEQKASRGSQESMTSTQAEQTTVNEAPMTGKKRKRENSPDSATTANDGPQPVEDAQAVNNSKKHKHKHSEDAQVSEQAVPREAYVAVAPSSNDQSMREVAEDSAAGAQAPPQKMEDDKASKKRKQKRSGNAPTSAQVAPQESNATQADAVGREVNDKTKKRKSSEGAPHQADNTKAEDPVHKGKGKSRAKEPDITATSTAPKQPPTKTKKTNPQADAEDDKYQVFPDPLNIRRPICPNPKCGAIFCHCSLKKQWCKCVCWSCGGRWKN